MKPLPGDYRHKLLISGDELQELKKHTYSMVEAFGLDRKIENYQGTRPITLYRWDLECLMDVIYLALRDEQDYPDQSSPAYLALKSLGERFREEYDAVYSREKVAQLGEVVTLAKRLATSSPVTAPGQKPGRKAPRKAPKRQSTIYQLKVTLADIKPPVWRRVEVEDCTLLKLHKIIQVSMGWDNYHMWLFDIDGEQYGDDVMDSTYESDFLSARKAKLSQFVQAGIKKFRYTYDMGANWDHVIQVEKVLDADPQAKYPRCVKGGRVCPPEDCGGPSGYRDFLDEIQNPDHESHDEMLVWVSRDFDPEAFDMDAINNKLVRVR